MLLARARSRKINVSCAVWWLALLRTRLGLSLSSLEDMLNACPVLLILPSVMHWTHWFTWLVPTLCLSEARAQLHVHEGQQQAGVTAEMGSVGLRKATARLVPDPTCWVPLFNKIPLLDVPDEYRTPSYLYCSRNLPASQTWLWHVSERQLGGGTLDVTITAFFLKL